MDKYFKWKVLVIIGAVALSIWGAYPPSQKVNLGLDLQGGMQLLLQVDISKVPEEGRKDATERVVEIIRNRIDQLGVKEPSIIRQGTTQVVVQLPGVTDRDRAKEIVGKTAHLEFKLVSDDSKMIEQATAGTVPEGYEYKDMRDNLGFRQILLKKDAALTGEHLTTASVGFDSYGQAIVQLQFDKQGAQIFDQVTFQNVGKQLAIVLDGKVHSAPVIRDRIPNGQAQISGNFSSEEASDLALVLRAGALPAPVNIIEERTVGASLGKDSIEKGLKASIIGALIVFLTMPAYYLLAGLVADIGLIVYVIIVIGSFALFHATLTMPGIAGFILSIGMAVDANVLIFERIREEMDLGKTPRAAVAAGYHKAFAAIFDSNLTTLITSVILFIFGTGPVKGFAVTLSLGVLASFFSALVVTRVIFDLILKNNPSIRFKMFQLFGATKIPFMKGRYWAYGFSSLVLGLGILSLALRGHGNYGVEFTGGTLAQVQFHSPVDVGQLRGALEKEGVRSLTIQVYGEAAENQFVIKTAEKDTKKIEKAAGNISGADNYKIMRVDSVGPTVSSGLKKKAFWAVIWSWVGILVYCAFRFEWKFSLAGVVALLHDTIFAFGIYSLSGREINLTTIAAVLTIMGYSINDTIVTFDRVRDNMKIMRKVSFAEIMNTSINQTLGRTIMTSFTVIIATITLFLFGGSAINDFAFILLVGFLVGVYSTIFVATSLVVDWKKH
ncbi:MAG: protein translocase subunit SecD [Candidatus Omnitrophica bacterium]|nr:protein translocase subunit SecD [Candidatus Omnitrophota bacterium]MDD5672172.1 protein translocase subunit SecD [Candidatus Omnitrophota bacterium]